MKKFTKYGISEEEERIACLVLYHIGDEYDAFDEELNDIDERLMNNSNRIDENYYLGGHCLDENYYLGLAEQDLNNNRKELDNDFDNWRKRLKVEEMKSQIAERQKKVEYELSTVVPKMEAAKAAIGNMSPKSVAALKGLRKETENTRTALKLTAIIYLSVSQKKIVSTN